MDVNKVPQKCGNGVFADVSVFSFHPVKHIACGEGGMVTTNSEELYKKLLMLRSHGITRDQYSFVNEASLAAGQFVEETEYPAWYMEMQQLGYNYRLTDFQAALGNSQLGRAEERLKRRQDIAKKYADYFKDKSYIKSHSGWMEGHAYHLFIIEVNNRYGLYNHLRVQGIFAQIHYIPCHLMPYYRNLGWHEGDMPVSEEYYKRCISLPMYPTLTDTEQEYVLNTIDDFFQA